MARCVVCDKFTRKTRYCSYYDAFIAVKEIHRSVKCDGYKRKKEA